MTTDFAPQHVQRLVVEHYKRITDVEIVPDATTPTVLITGRNAQGKSSVLDALETVFTGIDKRRTPKPIHDGETTARIVAETQDLVITRTFKTTTKGTDSTLTVAAKDGARYGSPQKMMDELFGMVALDPWAFAMMPAKDQRAALMDLVDLPFNLDEVNTLRAQLFTRRTDVNRELNKVTAQIEAVQPYIPSKDAPTEEVSAGDLIRRIQAAADHARSLRTTHQEAQQWNDRAHDLEEELARAKLNSEALEARLNQLNAQDAEDEDALQAQLNDIETSNRQARENAQSLAKAAALKAAQQDAATRAADLDTALRDIDARKAQGLAVAKFPVPGLGFNEEGITYQGQPFEQASTAERIRVSFAVATAKPGSIRVVLIRNAESLDSGNLALIGELAEEAGFQVWMERVSETRELGVFHMEDGTLA